MTKIDNIRVLYNQIENKVRFREKVAEEFNVTTSTVRTGWFSRFEIPSAYKVQENLIAFMQNYIQNQNKVVA